MKQCLLLLACCALLFGACKKASEPDTQTDALRTGDWKVADITYTTHFHVGGDTAVHTYNSLPDCVKDNRLYFSKTDLQGVTKLGSSACVAGEPVEKAFQWLLTDNDNTLLIYNAQDIFGTTDINSRVLALSQTRFIIQFDQYTNVQPETRDTTTFEYTFIH